MLFGCFGGNGFRVDLRSARAAARKDADRGKCRDSAQSNRDDRTLMFLLLLVFMEMLVMLVFFMVITPFVLDFRGVVVVSLCCESSITDRLQQNTDKFGGKINFFPALYGESERTDNIDTCPPRDRLENLGIRIAPERDMALLGICRGLQFLNVSLGGTLYQDVPTEVKAPLVHLHTPPEEPVTHDIVIEPDTPLSALLQKQQLRVNSFHHQGVRELAPALRCMARATDGVLEAA